VLGSPEFGSSRTMQKDSKARTIKLEDVNSFHPTLFVYDSPPHLLERIDLALSMDKIFIDDLEHQCEDDLEAEYFAGDPLGNGKVKLVQVEYENENSSDTGEPDIDVLGNDLTSLMGVE
jgi:hypothetical protein